MPQNPITEQPEIEIEEEDAVEFHTKQKIKAKFNSSKN